MLEAEYWRIRIKDPNQTDFSRAAWDRDEVGIWYGAWTAANFAAAREKSSTSEEIAAELNDIPAQHKLEWLLKPGVVDTARRFADMPENEWVVVYLRDLQEIGLARVHGQLCSSDSHPFNSGGEPFKYRRIADKKTFKLSRLPDACRLLPTQGRGNVHQFNEMWEHVKLLAENQNEEDVDLVLSQKPFDELLDLLGASGWESFCFAYLVLEQNFLPTGLSTGRNMPTADIVGRRKNDGSRIIAQCKKHKTPRPMDSDFRSLTVSLGPLDSAFYFAYGGCTDQAPGVQIIDRTFALLSANSDNGGKYRGLLLGNEVTPAAPTGKIKLNVTSTPAGAEIRINGSYVGKSPSVVQADPGELINLDLEMRVSPVGS
jgi:PEGA domain